ncbi:hypothetical protein VTO73DRAFT_13841 [Trametes versicolor]
MRVQIGRSIREMSVDSEIVHRAKSERRGESISALLTFRLLVPPSNPVIDDRVPTAPCNSAPAPLLPERVQKRTLCQTDVFLIGSRCRLTKWGPRSSPTLEIPGGRTNTWTHFLKKRQTFEGPPHDAFVKTSGPQPGQASARLGTPWDDGAPRSKPLQWPYRPITDLCWSISTWYVCFAL